MRRLTQPKADDHGVATIILIGAMTALLIATALAVDVGRLVAEVRAAQNSADATVLAVATDCAAARGLGSYTNYYKSTSGQTISSPTCGTGETTVTVTKDVNSGLFLNRDAKTVSRSATAKWGTLGRATTLPIVISKCEFLRQPLDSTGDITLLLDNPQPGGCSSPAGGFSQLASSGCSVIVSASGTAAGKPGNDLQNLIDCILPLPRDILIPMYDPAACPATNCKGQGPYTIIGFAMFRVTGYWFTNNVHSGGTLKNAGCPAPTAGTGTGTQSCIRGDFIRFVTSQGSPGPSTDFGTLDVYLFS